MKRQLLKWGMAILLVVLSFSETARAATVSWIGGSGDWNTTANWSTGNLPGTNDDVVIGAGTSVTVTHSSGTHTVKSLTSEQVFQLTGGSIAVSNSVKITNTLLFLAGRWQAGSWCQPTGHHRWTNSFAQRDSKRTKSAKQTDFQSRCRCTSRCRGQSKQRPNHLGNKPDFRRNHQLDQCHCHRQWPTSIVCNRHSRRRCATKHQPADAGTNPQLLDLRSSIIDRYKFGNG